MKSTIRSFVHLWRRAFFGALTLLAVALPAGANPALTYSTYLGGSLGDTGLSVATRGGDTFVAGLTNSLDYPVFMANSSKPTDQYNTDVFVTALGPSGDPIYSTYVPMGSNNEALVGIGIGPDGSAYVAALAFAGSENYVVVAKLYPWGALEWIRETYGRLFAYGMAVDSQGNVYVTGRNNNPDENYVYMERAYVWKVRSDGTTAYWSEIDGRGFDLGRGVAVDAAGNAYVTGFTTSNNLPRSIQAAPVGGENAFVTKLDPAGNIVWSTYLGGNGEDHGEEISVAADGTIVVAGTTTSTDFFLLNPMQSSLRGPKDLFVARLRSWGSRISSTYVGGSGTDEVEDLALEASNILLAVNSPGMDSPLRQPLDPSCGASFVAKLNAGASGVVDAACLGNSLIYGVAADSSGVSLTGAAGSSLPLANAWQPSPAGGGDAFAAKLSSVW